MVDYGGLAPSGGGGDVPSGEESDEELVRLTPAPAAERSDVWTGFRRRAARIAAGLVAYAVVLTVVDVTRVTTINTDAAAEATLLRVALPAAGAPMLLTATASFDRPDDCAYAVRYAPTAGSSLPALWTAATRTVASLDLYRLRPATAYAAELFRSCDADEPELVASATFTSRATGFLRFDGAPYADVRGAPSWALGSLATFPGFEASDSKVFEGLFAIDAEGWVVWAYAACAPEAWDRTASGSVVVLSRAGGGCAGAVRRGDAPAAFEKLRADGETVDAATSRINVVAVDGTLEAQHLATCGGPPSNFSAVSHEARVLDDGRIATTSYSVRIGTVATQDPDGTTISYGLVASSLIDVWDPATGAFETLYDLADLAPLPFGRTLAGRWNAVRASCGPQAEDALDYHHVSSVSVSETTGDFIVASRNLDAVWSLRADGSGARWTLDAAAFADAGDAFAAPHAARQLGDGSLLLVDDGNSRPGCAAIADDDLSPCYSRVARYEQDDGSWRLAWAFAFPEAADSPAARAKDVFNAVGGSVAPRDGGGYVVGFTSLADRDGAVPGGLVLDVDAAGHVAATAALPRDGSSSAFSQNAYRFVPWDSIAGESAASPLSGGAWELYKYAFAVGPGAAPRALDVAGAVLGPPEAVLNLGCDGRKASVDLAPHGPQLHWVEAPPTVDGAARAAEAAAALAAAHDDALRRGEAPGADHLSLFVPDLAAPLAALAALDVPVLRRRSESFAHAAFDVEGHMYELVAPLAAEHDAWAPWAADECGDKHAILETPARLLELYAAAVADASDGVRAWAAARGHFPPLLAGVTVAVPAVGDSADALGDLAKIAGLAALPTSAACAGAAVAVKIANSDATVALRFAPSAAASAAAAAAESDASGLRSRDDWGGWSHWLDRHVGLKYVPGQNEDAACDVSRRVSAALEGRAVAQRTAYDFGPAGELHWYVAYGPTAVEYHVRECVAATTNGNAEVCMCAPTNNDADYAALTGGLSCYDPPANAGTTRGVDDDGAS